VPGVLGVTPQTRVAFADLGQLVLVVGDLEHGRSFLGVVAGDAVPGTAELVTTATP
jgi:hypothetical protein